MFGLIPGESWTRILKTEWVFGVTTGGGSGINSNDHVKEVRYPDPSTGSSSSTDKDTITVNALGQKLTVTDRNGNTHTYSYDTLSRPTADAVTTLGSGVDGTVRRITTGYSPLGAGYLFTSYDAASGGNVVNQVKDEFNGLGQVIKEWQEHSGAVTGSSANVQYAYSEMAGGANHSRLTSMTYASGYVLNYNYGSGLDSTISRLTSLSDSGNTLESYSYLGLATIVKRAHAQSGVDLSYIKLTGESVGDAGDQYTGLDRFQRIVDQRWINGSNVDVDRYRYGYDRNGNRLYKENLVITGLSEVYTYDDLNQLASYKLGTLNTGKTDVTGTPTNAQSWDYDAVGNWDSVTTNSTTQTRGANRQNEITSVSGATTPTYDNNGNLTTDENNYRFVYDAWNRQVKIKNSSNTVIATNAYDALNHKVQVTTSSGTIDQFFSNNWQVLEGKNGSNTQNRYVWSPAYVDGLVTRDRDTDANGTLDERLFALQDANWNVTGITNTSGTIQERYTETPYGAVTFRDGSGSTISVSTNGWDILHQGAKTDIIGDYDFRNRVYSPTLGRWLSNDPLGFEAGDANTFRYVGNGPGNKVDSMGLWPDSDVTQPKPNQGGNLPITPPNPNNGLPSWYIPQIPKPFPVYDAPTITIVPPTDWGYPGSKMIQIPPVEFHLPTEGSPGWFGPRPDQMTIPPGIHASTPIFPPGVGNGIINTHIGFDGKFDITGGYRDGVPGSGHEHGGEFSITNNDPRILNPIFEGNMWWQLPNEGKAYFGGVYNPGGHGIPDVYRFNFGVINPGGLMGNRDLQTNTDIGITFGNDYLGVWAKLRY